MYRYTARDLAAKLGVSYPVASGMLSFFEELGVVTVVDKLTHATGRGKKTKVYGFPSAVTVDFGEILGDEAVIEDETVIEETVDWDEEEREMIEDEEEMGEMEEEAEDDMDDDRSAALERLRDAV